MAALCRELVEQTGDRQLLLAFCRLNVERLPDDGSALAVLGGMVLLEGDAEEAERLLQRAVACEPGNAVAWSNLSVVLQGKEQLEEAVEAGYRAVELSDHWAVPHNNLGLALKDLGRLSESETILRQAIRIDPAYPEAWSNLGLTEQSQGYIAEAESCFRKALQLNDQYFRAHSNLLFLLNYSSDYSKEIRLREARAFGRAVAKMARKYSDWNCKPEPKRLRVGLVSGDLRNHPVGYFLESFLGSLGSLGIEWIAYPTNLQVDDLTARIRTSFAAWHPLAGLSDEEAARLIHGDGVHILLDLAGHTDHNRLSVFAWKPAPVQVSWLGYFATTGVAEMDYILADPEGVPETAQDQFIESVRYLPETRLCFAPPKTDLPVSSLPALSNGAVTLGSFQNLSKITPEVLEVWAQVLHGIPEARLRLQCSQLADTAVRERLLGQLRSLGIDSNRVALHGPMSRADYLAAYAEVDFLIDTFPYPGGTTTCEALWMGVPTLTLAGDSMLARQGASLMDAAGLPEWVAADRKSFVAKAIAFAASPGELAALRAGLRSRVEKSPLFDGKRFGENFEVVLRGLWDEHARNHYSTTKALD
ncbi:MAG TPA: tetratricopeptide repeat protein [Rhodocyclaceae bacterium]|nr:tetratricopeptide repeat protein [Rhodocyclaceae bacterium]